MQMSKYKDVMTIALPSVISPESPVLPCLSMWVHPKSLISFFLAPYLNQKAFCHLEDAAADRTDLTHHITGVTYQSEDR